MKFLVRTCPEQIIKQTAGQLYSFSNARYNWRVTFCCEKVKKNAYSAIGGELSLRIYEQTSRRTFCEKVKKKNTLPTAHFVENFSIFFFL